MYLAGVMFDAKFHGRHPRPEVELVEGVVIVALLQEGGVRRLGEVGLVVEQVEQADRFLGYQVDHRLVILYR